MAKYVITVKDDGSAVLKKFGKSADEADGKMGKLSKGLGIMAKGATAAAGSIAGTGAAMFAMIKTVNENIDRQGKFAEKIGFSVSALTEYGHAAELTGVKSETFNIAMQRFTRRLEEARNGTGEARGTLTELSKILGTDLVNSGMTVEQMLPLVADGFSKMGTQSERVRAAFKLFDTEGVGLAATLSKGSKGLEEMREEARKLGISISGDAAASAAQFSDELLRLKSGWQAIIRTFVVEATPKIIEMMQGLKQDFLDNKDVYVDFFLDLFRFVSNAIGSFQKLRLQVEIGFKSVLIVIAGVLETAAAAVILTLNDMIDKINILLPKSKEFGQIQFEAFKWTKNLAGDIKSASDELANLAENQKKIANQPKPTLAQIAPAASFIAAPSKKTEKKDGFITEEERKEKLKTINDEILEEWNRFYTRRDEIKAQVLEASKSEEQQRLDALQREFEEKAFYLENTEELERQHQKRVDEIKKEYAEAERQRKAEEFNMQMQQIAMTVSAFTTMGRVILGDSKKNAKARKALALTEAGVTQGLAIMKAWGSAPFPANLPAVLLTTAQTAEILTNMSARRFQAGGVIPGTGTLIQTNENGRPESILNADATSFLGRAGVNALNQGRTQDLLSIIAENTGGSAGAGRAIQVNISGGLVDNRYIEDQLLPAIEKASRRF